MVFAFDTLASQFRVARVNKDRQPKMETIRGGQVLTINAEDLLVGDIVIVEPGNVFNVDGVLLQGRLEVDESK